MNLYKRLLIPSVVALLAVSASLLHAQEDLRAMSLSQGTYEGVPFLSGGVGQGEREYITNNLAGRYNVKMEFAASNGDYLSAVSVRVIDPSGRTVLAAESQGPWFFARLSPGKYRVEATAENQTFTNSLIVDEQRMARLVLKGWRAQ